MKRGGSAHVKREASVFASLFLLMLYLLFFDFSSLSGAGYSTYDVTSMPDLLDLSEGLASPGDRGIIQPTCSVASCQIILSNKNVAFVFEKQHLGLAFIQHRQLGFLFKSSSPLWRLVVVDGTVSPDTTIPQDRSVLISSDQLTNGVNARLRSTLTRRGDTQTLTLTWDRISGSQLAVTATFRLVDSESSAQWSLRVRPPEN